MGKLVHRIGTPQFGAVDERDGADVMAPDHVPLLALRRIAREHDLQLLVARELARGRFGAVYQWMVENIGGIRNAAPAYKRIVIAPQPGGRLEWAPRALPRRYHL